MRKRKKKFPVFVLVTGILLGVLLVLMGNKGAKVTSTNEFCNACHVHPHVTISWKQSTHYNNAHGYVTDCVDCHLPPDGWPYYREKIKTGARDVYGVIFKDTEKINWEERSQLEHALNYTYEESCIDCHRSLFPKGLSEEGEKAHLHYSNNQDDVRCLNCHLGVGHYDKDLVHAKNVSFGSAAQGSDTIYQSAATIDTFESFTEYIPGTGVSFEMKAIPGGSFTMGSPEDEYGREPDEGPRVEVELSPFFMSTIEVSWEQYLAFFNETSGAGRSSDAEGDTGMEVDGITGPTPPWGAPDQGWGKGQRPAITMTHYAATVFCDWLSQKTGKKYRLPTEAEWEYAARGGTSGPYFFDADPSKINGGGFFASLFAQDSSIIDIYVNYKGNENARSVLPGVVEPNPFGLLHMLGNVAEFCQDYYDPETYQTYASPVKNPTGPTTGAEHVVRGGSFKSSADDVRIANREFTKTKEWLKTDPQIPKSKWWYSDVNTLGFRVVCETP